MKQEILKIPLTAVMPTAEAVLTSIGYRQSRPPADSVMQQLASALAAAEARLSPRGLLRPISREEFADVFEGEGGNDPAAPLADIYRDAESLALFVATVGAEISHFSDACFAADDQVLALLVDTVASLAADETAACLEREFGAAAGEFSSNQESLLALRYSPGYCGWHVSGQHKLFAACDPAVIGLTLRDSALMNPLKSVSGVIVAGPPESHRYRPDFEFCSCCKTRSCLDRMPQLDT